MRMSLALPERRVLRVDLDPIVTVMIDLVNIPHRHLLTPPEAQQHTLAGLHHKRKARGEGISGLLSLSHCDGCLLSVLVVERRPC